MKKSKETERLEKTLSNLRRKDKKLQKQLAQQKEEIRSVRERFSVIKVAFIGAICGGPAALVAFIIIKFLPFESNLSGLLIGGLIGGVFGAISINNWWFEFIYEKGWLKKISFNFSSK